MKWV